MPSSQCPTDWYNAKSFRWPTTNSMMRPVFSGSSERDSAAGLRARCVARTSWPAPLARRNNCPQRFVFVITQMPSFRACGFANKHTGKRLPRLCLWSTQGVLGVILVRPGGFSGLRFFQDATRCSVHTSSRVASIELNVPLGMSLQTMPEYTIGAASTQPVSAAFTRPP